MKRRKLLGLSPKIAAAIALSAMAPGLAREAIALSRRQNEFRAPDDCHKVKTVWLDGKEVKGCIRAIIDRGDGIGFVSFYGEPAKLSSCGQFILTQHAKGRVEVDLTGNK